MAIKPEDMLGYRCPADPDVESPQFWKKMSFVWALHDYRGTLDSFKNWNISLTDEQYAHIMGLSKMAQGMVRDYRAFEAKLEDPVSVIADDPRLTGDRLEKAQQNIFFPYRDDGEPADKEAADRLRRFSKERSGVTLNIFMDTKRKDTNAIEAV